MFDVFRNWARRIGRDAAALWIAARDPRTPWIAKAVAAFVAAYALSPIDLIPDIIPIVGLLDDLLIVPVGIVIAVKLIPSHLMFRFRRQAMRRERPMRSRAGGAIVIAGWILGLIVLVWLFRAKPVS